MKRIKCIIALLFVFILSGCTVDYDIEISADSINELATISENNSRINDNILSSGVLTYRNLIDKLNNQPQAVYVDAEENPYNDMATVEGVDYYSKKLISNTNKYGIEFNFKHDIDDYSKASTITKCYKNISVLDYDDTLTLSTSKNNLCFEQYKNLDEINVNITFDPEKYSIVSHNADEVIENKYTWSINRQNYSNKSIVIELETVEAVRKRENAMYLLIGVIIAVCIGIGLVYLIVKKQSQSKNEI